MFINNGTPNGIFYGIFKNADTLYRHVFDAQIDFFIRTIEPICFSRLQILFSADASVAVATTGVADDSKAADTIVRIIIGFPFVY